MVVITRKKGETKDAIFRKFSRSFIEEDIVSEIRKRQFYKKPSLKRKDEEKERLQRKAKLRRGFRKPVGGFFNRGPKRP
jgi:small subunit ribosomal protein S21